VAEAPKITVADLRQIVTDSDELSKGARLYDDGDLGRFAAHEAKLFADAQGSTVYKVSVTHGDKGWKAKCSCMAARSRPFCKHAAALLVAWQRNPDGFAVATAPPGGDAAPAKKKAVKASKVDVAQLMAKGVEQVTTLVRELAVVGAASVAEDRAAQVRSLGENLREHRLRRLSANTIRLADQLEASRGENFDHLGYAELLGDLLLTARKLEKHIAGETLESRHVEELIGKTWTKKDRAPVAALDLVEIAFLQRETPDNFVIRESRFIDAASGDHYSEKQILPGFLVRRTPPKPSYAGKLLRGAGGGLYPGYAPRRTDLETPGTIERLTADTLDRVVERALPSVKQAIAALADHKKDVFAPEKLPVAVACDMLIADRGRLQIVDKDGAAIFLPDNDGTSDRLAIALSGVGLVVVIGDLGFDGALPTIEPLAVIVASRAGRELRSIAIGATQINSRKIDVPEGQPERRSNWAHTARGLGLSTAAIALGELREEIADLVFSGLTSVTPRRVEPMAVRLGELGLAKQVDLLREAAAREDASARLDDVIKLQQVLGIALARLAGAAHVDRDQLTASPLYASVFVRKDAELLEPLVIARKLRRGEINRFEAGALSARYYDTLPAESLLERVYPLWADGAASPFIALAAPKRPELGLAGARSVLTERVDDDPRKVQRIRRGRHPRMAAITAMRVLEAIGGDASREILRIAATGHTDATTRNLARAAMGRLARIHPQDDPNLARYREDLLNASTYEARASAAERLADAGSVAAIPLLRLSFAGDISGAVRDAAGRALGRLGDAESVDTFCIALDRRADDHELAKTAAYALGYLGDIRGVDALIAAYAAGWLPSVVAESIAAIGPAAVPQLIELVEENPSLLKRTTADNVFDSLRGETLIPALLDRVDAIAQAKDFVPRAMALFEMLKNRSPLDRELGTKILQVRPDLATGDADARALARKAGARIST
jgi:HEAT repeat protein